MSIVHIAFYPSDWLAGTRGMSAEETGVYITLIARIYEMAGPIERDDRRLTRLCGCKSRATFVRILEYLMSEGKIIETENGLTNDRAEKEIQNTTVKSDKARAAAQSRWDRKPNKNNKGKHANASPEHMPEPCQPEPEPYIGGGDGSACAREAEILPPEKADLTEREMLLKAMGYEPSNGFGHTASGAMVGKFTDMREYQAWRDDLGLTWDEVMAIITEVMAGRKDPEPPTSFKYFSKAMRRLAADKAKPPMQPDHTPSPRKGTRNDRAAEHHRNDAAFRETVRRIESGEIQLRASRRSPFGD